jgi:anti-sigma factor RsiW
MNSRLAAADVRAIHRFADGAMSDREQGEFRERLEREPELRLELQALRSLMAGFAAGRADVLRAPPEFTRRLMNGVQQTATDPSWRQHVLDDGQVVRWCRRILLVAAALLFVAAAWRIGILPGQEPDSLSAAPEVLRLEMQRLDERIRETGGTGTRPRVGHGVAAEPPSPLEGPRRK